MTVLVTIATLLLCASVPTPPGQAESSQQHSTTQQEKGRQSESGVTLKGDSNKPEANASRAHADNKDENTLNTIYQVSAPIVAIVGFGTLILVWKQIRVLRGIERAQVDLDFVPVGGFSYKVQLSNYGKSIATLTAYNLIHATYPLATKHLSPEAALAIFEDTIPMHSILGPGLTQKDWNIYDLRNFLTEEALTKHDAQVVISGLIEYKDIFGKRHETEVVYRFRVLPASAQVIPLWEYGKNT